MQIDFKATYDQNGRVYFLDHDEKIVVSFPIAYIQAFVELEGLNQDVFGIASPVDQYIDDNWFCVTQRFYESRHNSDHIANNTPQKTRKQIA